jgi:hypothetical protein
MTHNEEASMSHGAVSALQWCVGDVETFLDTGLTTYFHRRAVFTRDSLPVSVEEIDDAVTGRAMRLDAIKVAKNNVFVAADSYVKTTSGLAYGGLSDVVDPVRLAELLRGGSTVLVRSASLHLPRLNRFCKEIESVYGHSVDADIFMTPPSAQGFNIHTDAADGFIIQIAGSKQWELFDPPDEDGAAHGRRLASLDVGVGDVLYIPRGLPHGARTTSEFSVHVTVSVNTLSWADVLHSYVSNVMKEPGLDGIAPIGPDMAARIRAGMTEKLRQLLTMVEDHGRVESAIFASDGYGDGVHAGLLTSAVRGHALWDGAKLQLRPGVWPTVSMAHDGRPAINLNGRRVRVPADVAEACDLIRRRVASVDEFGADPGRASTVATSLIRLGIAEVVS